MHEVGEIWHWSESDIHVRIIDKNVMLTLRSGSGSSWERGDRDVISLGGGWKRFKSNLCVKCSRFNPCNILEVECAGCRR